MDTCIFCKIVNKEIKHDVVYENEDVVAFLDARPINPGHTLVIPKKHFEGMSDVGERELRETISVVKKIAASLKTGLNAEGVNVGQNNGKVAGQAVFHLHFHVIPRYSTDGLKSWHRDNPDVARMSEIAQILRKTLE